ncbi:MAG TPA: cytochrome P450 [Acidimicrobiia bacterium]
MNPLGDADLTDLDNFAAGFPHDVFAVHRQVAPVFWHEPTAHTPDGEGFWSVATYAETEQIQNDPATYSSERGGDRRGGGTLLQDLEIAGLVLNMMDDPRHNRIRRLVSSGLTPRMIRRLEGELRHRTRVLLDPIGDGDPIDFLTAVAAELPMQAICILLGVPEVDRHRLWAAVDPGFDIRAGDAGFAAADPTSAQLDMLEYGSRLIEDKRACPVDDMLSTVVHATLDDEDPPRLDDMELYSFFSLLFAAGSETTRNAIAGGLLALIERPDQLDRLAREPQLLPRAIEEMLRWTAPSPSKRRTATRDTELRGHRISAGHKVLFWEASANRDEVVFGPTAMEFDVTRDPNPHLTFGHGAHFCLGAGLARLEMQVMFEELFAQFGAFALDEPVEWTRSNRHTGIRHMHLRMRAGALGTVAS